MAAWFICIVGLIATIGCGGALNESLSEFAIPPVQTAVGVSVESLLKALETLAFDEFAGRAPGSPGEALTIDYLSHRTVQGARALSWES